jgi:protein TonB
MITRYASSLSSAAWITFGLLFVMQLLIATGEQPVVIEDDIHPPVFAIQRVDTVTRTEEDVTPPPPVDPPPPKDILDSWDKGEIKIIDRGLIPTTKIKIPKGMPGRPDGGVIAVAIIQPVYPRRLRQRGLEGYVVVEFTVTAIGNIKDAFVTDSSSKLFEKSALRAVNRFKYKPQVVDGIAIDTPGIRYLFKFEFAD